jgi:outer membrane immunogenic protein
MRTKTIALALAILTLALSRTSFAGPEPISDAGKDMKQVVPTESCGMNWTGFYVGAFGAYTRTLVDADTRPNGLWDTQFPEGRDAIEAAEVHDLDHNGAEAGGLIGYNYQWHNWVFGAEAAGGYVWSRTSNSVSDIPVAGDPVDAYDLNTQFQTRYLFTAGPRIGYSFCRWMPYVTGGVAVGGIDFHQQVVNILAPIAVGESFRDDSSKEDTRVGWMVGGGLEYALTNHWHLRGQYQYMDLGSTDYTSAGAGTIFNSPAFTIHHDIELREHNASLALIFQF